jgi:DNA polymerase III sliding clamp (beta) subunit (PCNA family)
MPDIFDEIMPEKQVIASKPDIFDEITSIQQVEPQEKPPQAPLPAGAGFMAAETARNIKDRVIDDTAKGLGFFMPQEKLAVRDTPLSLMQGAANVGTTAGAVGELATHLRDTKAGQMAEKLAGTVNPLLPALADVGGDVAAYTRKLSKDAEEYWRSKMSPEGKQPTALINKVAMSSVQSAPGMVAMAGMSAPLVASAKGIPALAKMGKLGKFFVASPEALAAGVGEGIFSAGQNAAQVGDKVREADLSSLQELPEFAAAFAATSEALPAEDRAILAREAMARHAEDQVFLTTAPWTAASGAATGGTIANILKKGFVKGAKGIVKELFKNITEEAAQETIQSAGEQALQNAAEQRYINPDAGIMEGVGESALVGGLSGGLMGAVGGGVSAVTKRLSTGARAKRMQSIRSAREAQNAGFLADLERGSELDQAFLPLVPPVGQPVAQADGTQSVRLPVSPIAEASTMPQEAPVVEDAPTPVPKPTPPAAPSVATPPPAQEAVREKPGRITQDQAANVKTLIDAGVAPVQAVQAISPAPSLAAGQADRPAPSTERAAQPSRTRKGSASLLSAISSEKPAQGEQNAPVTGGTPSPAVGQATGPAVQEARIQPDVEADQGRAAEAKADEGAAPGPSVAEAVAQGLPVRLPPGTVRIRATFANGKTATVNAGDIDSLAGVGPIRKLEPLRRDTKGRELPALGKIQVKGQKAVKAPVSEQPKPNAEAEAIPVAVKPAPTAPPDERAGQGAVDPRPMQVAERIATEADKASAKIDAKNAQKYGQVSKQSDPRKPEEFVKSGEKLVKMIDEKDADGLRSYLGSPGFNEGSRIAFGEITGVKLPKTQKETYRVIDQWAGVSEEERAIRDQNTAEARHQEGVKDELKNAKFSADQIKIKMPDGAIVAGSEAVDKMFADGYTRLSDTSGGRGVKRWALANDAKGTAFHIKTGILRYARAKIAADSLSRQGGEANKQGDDNDKEAAGTGTDRTEARSQEGRPDDARGGMPQGVPEAGSALEQGAPEAGREGAGVYSEAVTTLPVSPDAATPPSAATEAIPGAGETPTYKAGNPFALRARSARIHADRLGGQTLREKAMAQAFPHGVGGSGKRPQNTDRQIDASVKRAKEAVEAKQKADYLEAQAKAFDEGRINTQGRSIKTEAESSEETKAENELMASVKVGDSIDVGGNDTLRVIKVNAKSVITEGGSKWTAGEIARVIPAEKMNAPAIASGWDASTAFLKRAVNEPVTAKEAQDAYAALKASKEATIAGIRSKLDADPRFARKRKATKDEIAEKSFKNRLERFARLATDGITWQPFSEKYEQAIDRMVSELTDESIKKHFDKRARESAETKKALENPETLHEFGTFVANKGDEALSPEQRIKYDTLRAEAGMMHRENAKIAERAIVGKVEGAADTPMSIVERMHSKRGKNVFIVTMGSRVDGDTFKELARKARALGGNWSREWKPTDSPAGFMFNEKDKAEQFMGLRTQDVDQTAKVVSEKEETREAAAERLTQMADKMESDGSESLGRDRLSNTAKRARQADSAEAEASAKISMAKTIRNIAIAVKDGRAKFLKNLRTRTQVEELARLAKEGRRNRIEQIRKTLEASYVEKHWREYKTGNYTSDNEARRAAARGAGSAVNLELRKFDEQPISQEDVSAARFPDNRIFREQIEAAAKVATQGDYRGQHKSPRLGIQINAFLRRNSGEYVLVPENLANDITTKLPGAAWALDSDVATAKRLRAMNVTNDAELRSAIREYLEFKEDGPGVDKAKKLRREIVGQNVGIDYFPTPPALAAEVVRKADIRSGDSVLEPEAGDGQLANQVRAQHPEAPVAVIELSSTLRKILEAEGHNIVGQDFMEYTGPQVDRIVMNPPFGGNADIQHVRHAYDMLKPGGRLVAIMSEHAFFGSEKEALDFRDWLDDVGGVSEQNPENSFMDKTIAGPTTGVNTRTVVIDKPAEVQAEREAAKEPDQPPAALSKITPEIVEKQRQLNTAEAIYRRRYGDESFSLLAEYAHSLNDELWLSLVNKVLEATPIGNTPTVSPLDAQEAGELVARFEDELATQASDKEGRNDIFQFTDKAARVAEQAAIRFVTDHLPTGMPAALERIESDAVIPLAHLPQESADDLPVYAITTDVSGRIRLVAEKSEKLSSGEWQNWFVELDQDQIKDLKWDSPEAKLMAEGRSDEVAAERVNTEIGVTPDQIAEAKPDTAPSVEAASKSYRDAVAETERLRKELSSIMQEAKDYAEKHDLLTTRRGRRGYYRTSAGDFKASAKKLNKDAYTAIKKRQSETEAKLLSHQEEVEKPARNALDTANYAKIANDQDVPEISRLAAQVGLYPEDETAGAKLLSQARVMAKELHPGATEEEVATIAPFIGGFARVEAVDGKPVTIEALRKLLPFENRLQINAARFTRISNALSQNGMYTDQRYGMGRVINQTKEPWTAKLPEAFIETASKILNADELSAKEADDFIASMPKAVEAAKAKLVEDTAKQKEADAAAAAEQARIEALPIEEAPSGTKWTPAKTSKKQGSSESVLKAVVKGKQTIPILGMMLVKDKVGHTSDLEVYVSMPMDKPDGMYHWVKDIGWTKNNESPEDFVVVPEIKGASKPITFEGALIESFKKGLLAVRDATSTDETRHALNGIRLEVQNGVAKLIATDGRRLHVATIGKVKSEAVSMTLPRKTVELFLKSNGQGPIVITTNGDRAVISDGNAEINTRLIDAQFPNYTQVIPSQDDQTVRVEVNREALGQALDDVTPYLTADPERKDDSLPKTAIRLVIGPKEVTLTAKNGARQYHRKKIVAVEKALKNGESIEMAVSAGYLAQLLKQSDSETVIIGAQDYLSPLTLSSMDGSAFGVVMPMRVSARGDIFDGQPRGVTSAAFGAILSDETRGLSFAGTNVTASFYEDAPEWFKDAVERGEGQEARKFDRGGTVDVDEVQYGKDDVTSVPTVITAHTVSAKVSRFLAAANRESYLALSKPGFEGPGQYATESLIRNVVDRFRRATRTTRITREALGIDPETEVTSWPTWQTLTSSKMKRIAGLTGGEGIVFRSKNGRFAYKLYPVSRGVGATLRLGGIDSEGRTKANAVLGTYENLLEKLSVMSSMGGTPTEILGITDEGIVVTKQPWGGKEFAEESVDKEIARMGAVNASAFFVGPVDAEYYVSVVDGVPYLVSDIRNNNFVQDNNGLARLIDPIITRIPAGVIDGNPELKALISKAGKFESPNRSDISFYRNAQGQVRAVTRGNRSHFFLDRYDNESQLRGDIREEAGHRLINELGGPAWRTIGMQTYGGKWGSIVSEIERNYGFKPGTSEFNHELVAKALRDGKHKVGLLRRFMDAVVSAFKRMAGRLGLKLNMGDAEVRNFLNGLLKAKTAGASRSIAQGVQFAKGPRIPKNPAATPEDYESLRLKYNAKQRALEAVREQIRATTTERKELRRDLMDYIKSELAPEDQGPVIASVTKALMMMRVPDMRRAALAAMDEIDAMEKGRFEKAMLAAEIYGKAQGRKEGLREGAKAGRAQEAEEVRQAAAAKLESLTGQPAKAKTPQGQVAEAVREGKKLQAEREIYSEDGFLSKARDFMAEEKAKRAGRTYAKMTPEEKDQYREPLTMIVDRVAARLDMGKEAIDALPADATEKRQAVARDILNQTFGDRRTERFSKVYGDPLTALLTMHTDLVQGLHKKWMRAAKVVLKMFHNNDADRSYSKRFTALTDDAKVEMKKLLDGKTPEGLEKLRYDEIRDLVQNALAINKVSTMDVKRLIMFRNHSAREYGKLLAAEVRSVLPSLVNKAKGVPRGRSLVRKLFVDDFADAKTMLSAPFTNDTANHLYSVLRGVDDGINRFAKRYVGEMLAVLKEQGITTMQMAEMESKRQKIDLGEGQVLEISDAERLNIAAGLRDPEWRYAFITSPTELEAFRGSDTTHSSEGVFVPKDYEAGVAAAEAIEATITPDERKIVDQLVRLATGMAPEINQVSRQLLGRSIATKDVYWPIERDVQGREIPDYDLDIIKTWTENSGFTNDRVRNKNPLVIRSVFQKYMDHAEQVGAYVHATMPLLNIRNAIVADHGALRTALNERMGSKYIPSLLEMMQGIAGKSKNTVRSEVLKAINKVGSNVAKSALFLNVNSWFANKTGNFLFWSELKEIDPKLAARFAMRSARPVLRSSEKYRQMYEGMTEAAPYLWARWEENYVRTMMPTTIDERSGRKHPRWSYANKRLDEIGLSMMRDAEITNALNLYDTLTAGGYSKDMAAATVAELTRRTQNATSELEMGTFLRQMKRSGAGWMFPFISQTVVAHNLMVNHMQQGRYAAAARTAVMIVSALSVMNVWRELLKEILSGQFPPSDEKKAQMASNVITGAMEQALPYMAAFSTVLDSVRTGKTYNASIGTGLLERPTADVMRGARKIANGKDGPQDWVNFVNGVLSLFGRGSGGAANILNALIVTPREDQAYKREMGIPTRKDRAGGSISSRRRLVDLE